MPLRNKNAYQNTLYDFVRDIFVVCPQCTGKALVHCGNFQSFKYNIDEVRVVCGACGYNKTLENIPRREQKDQKQGVILRFGAPIDPFFQLPLWLQTDVRGETLWAYNLEHLNLMEQHVGAQLRERNGYQFKVRSIGARLPRWMTAAHNRTEILKAIRKLKER